MSGLREQQKQDRELRLLQAAAQCFKVAGYDQTKIEDIASVAGVSPGTVYNYYGHKGEMLIALVAMDVNDVLKAGEPYVRNPPLDLLEAVDGLIGLFLEKSLEYLNKDSWRHAIAASIEQPTAEFASHYTDLDARLADQVSRMLMTLQQMERIQPTLDPQVFGRMIFNNMNNQFIEFVKDDSITLERLREDLRYQHAALCKLIAVG
ncbi:MAG: TetR/AcrR family transcriptional regulator [Alphaproteobacteria bacterium]|nr:TetR/AcrR family transcriptional regulator [Alphaproteobacteria bacterium]